MKLEEVLHDNTSNTELKIRRGAWGYNTYISIYFNDIDEEHQFYDCYSQEYSLTPSDVMANDWEIYNTVCYAALYTTGEGLPAMYVINEEEFNNKQWPTFPYVTDWIRFEGE